MSPREKAKTIRSFEISCKGCGRKIWRSCNLSIGCCSTRCRKKAGVEFYPKDNDFIIAELWARTDISTGQGPQGECWEWLGPLNSFGYGVLSVRIEGKNRQLRANRISLCAATGLNVLEVPWDLYSCHECDNKACVRPSHLFWGTNSVNIKDAIEKGVCARGSKAYNSKLTEELVYKIRYHDLPSGATVTHLAEVYGISESVINHIKYKTRWKHV